MENTDNRTKTKKEILDEWSHLISLLDIYLQQARLCGGTLGHKVGCFKHEQIRLRKKFEVEM